MVDEITEQYAILTYGKWRSDIEADTEFLNVSADFSLLSRAVVNYLDECGITTVIEETRYIDTDYSDAYSIFYSRSFSPPPRDCIRYLFFRGTEADPNGFTDLTDLASAEIRAGFAGFMVVWQTDPPVIGRTVLPFPPNQSETLISITARYKVHVAGFELELDSAMFASKDHGVSACATIATWLATDLLHRKFDLRTCSSSELTMRATERDPKWGRPLPQVHGLEPAQVIRALTELEYGPYIHSFSAQATGIAEEKANYFGIIYGYISSGIPIIIACDVGQGRKHALVAIGMTVEAVDVADETKTAPSFANGIKSILVHDDRWGQFAKLIPYTTDEKVHSMLVEYYLNENDVGKLEDNYKPPLAIDVEAFIVPLPTDVILTSQYAHTLGVAYVRSGAKKREIPAGSLGPYRTYMCLSSVLKEASRSWETVVQKSAEEFRRTAMSKWVWVTECYPKGTKSPDQQEPIARVVMDATQLRFAKQRLVLAAYIKG